MRRDRETFFVCSARSSPGALQTPRAWLLPPFNRRTPQAGPGSYGGGGVILLLMGGQQGDRDTCPYFQNNLHVKGVNAHNPWCTFTLKTSINLIDEIITSVFVRLNWSEMMQRDGAARVAKAVTTAQSQGTADAPLQQQEQFVFDFGI